jgi:hypothetical protein
MARSGPASFALRDLSQRPSTPDRRHQGLRSGARDVALGARPRREELTHRGIRDPARDHERITA